MNTTLQKQKNSEYSKKYYQELELRAMPPLRNVAKTRGKGKYEVIVWQS